MKPGPMPKQMPPSTEGAFIRTEIHRPTQRTLLRGGCQISPTRRCSSPSPGGKAGGLRRRVGVSSPPPRRAPPPGGGGAFVPHVEPAGPPGTAHPLPTHRAPATWGPGRKRPQPSSTWEGARAHRLGGIPQAPEGRGSAHQTVSPDLEHAASCRYGWRSLAPIRRFGAPSPRRSHKTPTLKPTPSPSGVPDAHLHDAVRGLGCRHLHPHLLLQPPRPPLLRTPSGPPYTGGSTARPPRPCQEISLAMEAARLGIPFSNWANWTPIKVQGPAQASVRSPAPLSRQGWESLPVHRKNGD